MNSPKERLEGVTNLINLLRRTEQLSPLAINLQLQRDLLHFDLCLSEESFAQAKDLLTHPTTPELHLVLYKRLLMYLLQTSGDLLHQNKSAASVYKRLQHLSQFFDIPQTNIIQGYLNFLSHLKEESLENYEEACQSLKKVFNELESMDCPIPESLNTEIMHIYLKIGTLAMHVGKWETALSAFESSQQFGTQVKHLDHWIKICKEKIKDHHDTL